MKPTKYTPPCPICKSVEVTIARQGKVAEITCEKCDFGIKGIAKTIEGVWGEMQ